MICDDVITLNLHNMCIITSTKETTDPWIFPPAPTVDPDVLWLTRMCWWVVYPSGDFGSHVTHVVAGKARGDGLMVWWVMYIWLVLSDEQMSSLDDHFPY